MPSKTKILPQPVGYEEDEESWAKEAMAYAIIFYMVIFFLFLSRELMSITLSLSGLEEQTPGHHSLLLRTRRADLPSHGEGGWTSRGWGSFIINSLLLGRFGGLVMENVEGLIGGGGHVRHPFLLRIRKADPWSSGSAS